MTMATQPPPALPIFYKDLQPLSSSLHAGFHARQADRAAHLVNVHAVPITADEFLLAQRTLPIVFALGETPVPIALMGLNEGVNVYVDEEGNPREPFYIPAYVRRYPYMLARLQPDAQELSLCFDSSSGLVGDFADGEALFADGKPTETLNNVLKFCEEFEMSAQRTQQFVKELMDLDLLIDGEISIEPPGAPQPFIYRGFKMVDENRFRDLNGDKLRKINQNGILPLVVAHLFSLSLMRDVFTRQMEQGKLPAPLGQTATPANA
jgi:hypothetical protein